jgi:hypothetical protein
MCSIWTSFRGLALILTCETAPQQPPNPTLNKPNFKSGQLHKTPVDESLPDEAKISAYMRRVQRDDPVASHPGRPPKLVLLQAALALPVVANGWDCRGARSDSEESAEMRIG